MLILAPIHAQNLAIEATYPTVNAINQSVLPIRDRVDLARRLLNVRAIPPPPSAPQPRQLGEHQLFWVNNSTSNRTQQVNSELVAIGENIYVWAQTGHGISAASAQEFANAFDREVYHQTRELWGYENSPGIDGDPRIYALFTRELSPRALAIFSSQHGYSSDIVATSNEHEMMFFNLNNTGTLLTRVEIISAAAHEFQHMIRYAVDANEYNWLDEGFSTFTQQYLGFNTEAVLASSFLAHPNTQLNDWDSPNRPIGAHYGATLLFVTRFYDQYGLAGIQQLSREEADGWIGIEKTLNALGGPTADVFFADWVIANALTSIPVSDTHYRYSDLVGASLPAVTAIAQVSDYPYLAARQLPPYATDYIRLAPPSSSQSLAITFALPETTTLLPTSAPSGSHFWYSHKGDNSDTTLTRAFDLSDAVSAQLQYKVWYDLETLWDYGYVMVSADDGQTWQILSTPSMTNQNPNSTAYGAGYTGHSNGWLAETISLEDYVGQKILIRFEVITDDAITRAGMAIDDISIPQIGYASSAEEEEADWEARGWIRTDNRIPQNAWVQLVQVVEGDLMLARWLAPQKEPWQVTLDERASAIILAISPIAPLTTIPAPYTLSIALMN